MGANARERTTATPGRCLCSRKSTGDRGAGNPAGLPRLWCTHRPYRQGMYAVRSSDRPARNSPCTYGQPLASAPVDRSSSCGGVLSGWHGSHDHPGILDQPPDPDSHPYADRNPGRCARSTDSHSYRDPDGDTDTYSHAHPDADRYVHSYCHAYPDPHSNPHGPYCAAWGDAVQHCQAV